MREHLATDGTLISFYGFKRFRESQVVHRIIDCSFMAYLEVPLLRFE